MSAAQQRIRRAYEEGGREAIERDPELVALIAQEPELGALLERAERIDEALRQLPPVDMPMELEARIRHGVRARRRRGLWSLFPFERGLDFAAVGALLLLALLPSAAGLWFLEDQRAEISVLDLPTSTVQLYLPVSTSRTAGVVGGNQLVQVGEAPTATIIADGTLGKKLDGVLGPLRQGHLPERTRVAVEALVNAVPFAGAIGGEGPLSVVSEAGAAPWSGETRLLRVQVDARLPLDGVGVEVAFNMERVAAYRLLASMPSGEAASPTGRLQAGETFVALFEVVPKATIADPKAELATVRVKARDQHKNLNASVAVNETRGRFEVMPAAFRYAAAAAWLGLELSGDRGAKPEPRALERLLAIASKALHV